MNDPTITRADVCVTPALTLAALPPIGAALHGGEFAGLTTLADGAHVAVVRLPGVAQSVTWQQAMDWAAERGGVLPSRPAAALLFARIKDRLPRRACWTDETHEVKDSSAWLCNFSYGNQNYHPKSWQASAVAVRLIPIKP